ncbi:MAG TPA: hypothetical protein VGK59_04395 [Ohtaekwangia sp.]
MPKPGSQENHAGKITVKSSTYKVHVRNKRGTHKPAVLNDACKEASARLLNANIPAKIINDAIEPYREQFSRGQLWQRLVSHFRQQLRESSVPDFSTLRDMDVQENYPLSHALCSRTEVSADRAAGTLHARLICNLAPKFRYTGSLTGYRIGMVVIYPDVAEKSADTADAYTPVFGLGEEPGTVVFTLPLKENATQVVLCTILEAYEGNKPSGMQSGRAMQLRGFTI